MRVIFPKAWELQLFSFLFSFLMVRLKCKRICAADFHCEKEMMKLLSNMAKYHHTSLRICKRKEHKAAPPRSRHAKHSRISFFFLLFFSLKGALKTTCWWVQVLHPMATDGKPSGDKTWINVALERGDNLMPYKVNWSAERLLTNYFKEVVSRNCINVLYYLFLLLISSKE